MLIERQHMLTVAVLSIPLLVFRNRLLDHKDLITHLTQCSAILRPMSNTNKKGVLFVHTEPYNQAVKRQLNNPWSDQVANGYNTELERLAYSSRLLGSNPDIVLEGGGNTSIKLQENDLSILYVKGSGRNLAQVTQEDFTPLLLSPLQRAVEDNVNHAPLIEKIVAKAIINPDSARPSIETLMHAALPYCCVMHTHADSVLAAMNVDEIHQVHSTIYGSLAPLVDYQHSGFDLARACWQALKNQGNDQSIGLILAFHGAVSFGKDVRQAYENMLHLISLAQNYLNPFIDYPPADGSGDHLLASSWPTSLVELTLEDLHKRINALAGFPLHLYQVKDFSFMKLLAIHQRTGLLEQGPATPQHALYTKRYPLLNRDLKAYARDYRHYLDTSLGTADSAWIDVAPRIVIDSQWGLCAFGKTLKEAQAASLMYQHDLQVMELAQRHGHYRSAPIDSIAQAEFEYGGYALRKKTTL